MGFTLTDRLPRGLGPTLIICRETSCVRHSSRVRDRVLQHANPPDAFRVSAIVGSFGRGR
jgi:hypothetical protein